MPPTFTEMQFIVPAPSKFDFLSSEAEFCTVIPAAPITFRIKPELTISLLSELLVLLKVIELITVFVVTVMVWPGAMMTSSPAVGMKPPGQGALGVVEFQLPLPALVTVTAFDIEALASMNSAATTAQAANFFRARNERCTLEIA